MTTEPLPRPTAPFGSTTLGGCSIASTRDGRFFWASWNLTGKHTGEATSEAEAWAQAFSAATEETASV